MTYKVQSAVFGPSGNLPPTRAIELAYERARAGDFDVRIVDDVGHAFDVPEFGRVVEAKRQ